MRKSPTAPWIRIALVALLAVAGGLQPCGASRTARAAGGEVPLIPRDILFGNPERAAARLSPDGTQLAYLSPSDGLLNVFVAPRENLEGARQVTHDKVRGIRTYFWAYTSEHILYLQDTGGDEDFHVYRVDLESGKTLDLTPLEKVAAQVVSVSHHFPGEILIGLNDRNPQFHDIHRVNIETGERQLVQQNDEFASFIVDDQFQVRFATKFSPTDGSNLIFEPDGEGGWKQYIQIPMEDTLTTQAVGFDKTGRILYLIDSRGRDTGALTAVNLDTGKQTVIAENDTADISGAMTHPTEKTIEAVAFTYKRKEWEILDGTIEKDLTFLRGVADGDMEVTSRTLDDKHWIVAYLMDNGPVRYYHYDRAAGDVEFLFTNRTDLEDLPLTKMHPVVIRARDGLELVSYLTLPAESDSDNDTRPARPVPMVLLVHGGPWARDSWGYNPLHQLLSNRGYAVLSVNFRGSSGFGKDFLNAGNREWGAKMHDDLLDAVAWAVEQQITEADRVAIMGGSYGGYATLWGMTATPEVFACGVDIVGPSNILTLLSTIPPYWAPVVRMFRDRVGDFTTDEGREFLASRSPLTYVDQIKRPLLIGQGANDPRVKQAESDQIVSAMKSKNIPVTYVLYPDEGHGFAKPKNRLSFFAVAEVFLGQHLGGRQEKVGQAFAGSSISIPEGVDQIPGAAAALAEAEEVVKP